MIFRTDLAQEAAEKIRDAGLKEESFTVNGLHGERVTITSDSAAEAAGKKKGTYITLETEAVRNRATDRFRAVSEAAAKVIRDLLKEIPAQAPVLVAGLGNAKMTPDAIGPETAERVFVTSHILKYLPEAADRRLRPVCAMAPGVLGVTGIESADVISAVCRKEKIAALIVVDALAARRSERMFSTIQLTDAGIEPGAGVGNRRGGLNRETLGIPVLALGMPTVVYASSLTYEAVLRLLTARGADEEEAEREAEKLRLFADDLVVTPKEIDVLARDAAGILADALNLALHDHVSLEEIRACMR